MTILKDAENKSTTFSQLNAVAKLQKLAKHPFDLAKENNLTPQRLSKFTAESAGYKLLYGTERVDEETMKALLDLAHESNALEKMKNMQAGEVMNFIAGYPSDNRKVLHTALRDFFDHPQTAKSAVEATQIAHKEIDKLKTFIARLDKDNRFTDLVLVGIGGSELGPKAQYKSLLAYQKPGRHVHFLGNVDPDTAAMILKSVHLKKTLIVVVSKTGGTLETATNEELLRARFKEAGIKDEDHFVAITAKGSPMDDKKKYLEIFHMWDWVGGRFSSTSCVGGFLISFAFGFDVFWEFLRGCNAMDKAALDNDLSKNIPLLGALLGIWNRNFLNYTTLAVIPYSQALARYPSHIQQVDMESNGKRIDQLGYAADFETGPIIFGEPGTNAQHSFYQLIHQGTTIVPLELIGFKHPQNDDDLVLHGTTSQEKLISNLLAQAISLATGQSNENPNKVFPGNRPSHILIARQLTPFALGALLSYVENKIAFQGFIWGINSFDQEGVQLGKTVANKIIESFASRRELGIQKSSIFPLGEALLKQFDSL